MAREHVEFVQSQNVAWTPLQALGLRREGAAKRLSHDPATGAFTALVRYAAGFRAPAFGRTASEEFYVLEGSVTLDGRTLPRSHYAYVPAHRARDGFGSPDGALVLVFFNGGHGDVGPDELEPRNDATLRVVDAAAMPWDGTTLDPKLAHLRLSRKILRQDPDCRTYLLAGLPHGRPLDGRLQVERHPHDEEMFLIEGDMASPQGVMRPGAYFYRPREIVHGPHFSERGFLMFMRNPGTSAIRTEWSGEAVALPPDPPYAPVLPASAPPEWRRPLAPAPEY